MMAATMMAKMRMNGDMLKTTTTMVAVVTILTAMVVVAMGVVQVEMAKMLAMTMAWPTLMATTVVTTAMIRMEAQIMVTTESKVGVWRTGTTTMMAALSMLLSTTMTVTWTIWTWPIWLTT